MKNKNSKKKIRKEWKNILFNLIFGIISLTIIILFYKNILLTSLLLIIISIIGLIKWKSKITLISFICSGLFFSIAEMIAINNGVWNYSVHNIINIPWWLFIIWGEAGAFVYQMSIEIRKLGIAKK